MGLTRFTAVDRSEQGAKTPLPGRVVQIFTNPREMSGHGASKLVTKTAKNDQNPFDTPGGYP